MDNTTSTFTQLLIDEIEEEIFLLGTVPLYFTTTSYTLVSGLNLKQLVEDVSYYLSGYYNNNFTICTVEDLSKDEIIWHLVVTSFLSDAEV